MMRIFRSRVGLKICQVALCLALTGGGLLTAGSRVIGKPNFSGRINTEFIYHQLSEGLPTLQQPLPETESTTDLQLSLSGYTGACRYELQVTGYFHELLFETNQATVSSFFGPVLWEFGKKDWAWGKGLAFIPNYPLTQEAVYWGFENRIILSPFSLVAGVVRNNSQAGAGWLRAGKMFETSDWGTILSYVWRDERCYWQGGTEFSWDFLNGLSLHGGANIEFPERTGKYLLGGVYTGGIFTYIMEYYYAKNHYLFAGLSREPGLFSRWQWGIKELFSLGDGGMITILNLKYLKDRTVTPEIIITTYGGGKGSETQKNPVEWECVMRLEVKF